MSDTVRILVEYTHRCIPGNLFGENRSGKDDDPCVGMHRLCIWDDTGEYFFNIPTAEASIILDLGQPDEVRLDTLYKLIEERGSEGALRLWNYALNQDGIIALPGGERPFNYKYVQLAEWKKKWEAENVG